MTVLIVGADKLGNLPLELQQHGCQEVIHWDCRKQAAKKKEIPKKVDMVVVFHDFIGHEMMNSIKEKAKKLKLPLIFSKRSISDIRKKLILSQLYCFF
jgi:hypothetical protein